MTTENAVIAPDAPVIVEPSSAGRLSWGGLIGGLLVAVGIWLLLTVLGLAVNLSAVDPNDPAQSLRGIGMSTGIWSVVMWILALFVGGAVAGYSAGVLERPRGALHGFVLWSLATILSIFLVAGLVRTVVRGTLAAAQTAVTAAGFAGGGIGQALDLDVNTLIAPVNERLRLEGKPTVTPEEVQQAIRDVTVTAVQEGELDREQVIGALTANTRLSRPDAEDLANRIEGWFDARANVGQDVRRGLLTAADTTGKAMWWVFFGLSLGLAASVLGATAGTARRKRRAEAVATGTARPLVPAEAHTTA